MRLVWSLFILAALAASLPLWAQAPNLNGQWRIQRSAAGRESTQECTFTQKDAALSGTCRSERGPVQFTGKVEGRKITWTYKSESEGGQVTVVYNGTVESESKITGTVLAVEFSIEGEFTATKAN